MSSDIRRVSPLTMPWSGSDPFLFCVHHLDHYPASDGAMGVPEPQLAQRTLGNDFSRRDGFSMYHGAPIPGFPGHPHRGFETITFVRRGYVDHADSLGATARYGEGDVQWLTAGRGVQHAEMFPLLDQQPDNTLELFQIWFNLPARNKFAAPSFKMLWRELIPVWRAAPSSDEAVAEVTVVAGAFAAPDGTRIVPPSPPTDSWAADEANEVAIWLIRLSPGQSIHLPAARNVGVNRNLYAFTGESFRVNQEQLEANQRVEVASSVTLDITNTGPSLLQILLLQGLPIGEPVAMRGPFVMNTDEELYQAYSDYRATQFGGWPWNSNGPVHPADTGRFAQYPGQSTPDRPPTVTG